MRGRLQEVVTLWVLEGLVLVLSLHCPSLPVLQIPTMLNLHHARSLLRALVHPPFQIQVLTIF
jgi:hypothetical protein